MTTLEILDRLQGDALKDGELRKKLLATRLEKDPLTVFGKPKALCKTLCKLKGRQLKTQISLKIRVKCLL